MKKLMLLLLAMSAAACAQPFGASYELGQKLSEDSLLYIPKQRCLTAPGKVESCMRVRTRGVIYTIGYRSKGNVITYIETHDPAFATAGGLRVGSPLDGAAGTLLWMNDFGEVAGPDTSDGWQPIIARDRTLQCDNGRNLELSTQESRNTEPCPIRVLGFKKRAHEAPVRDASRTAVYVGQ